MYAIQQLTADPKQSQQIVLTDGTVIDFTIQYKDLCLGWFITELIYDEFSLINYRICTSPNLLRQYRNQIPFGLCVQTQDSQEPTTLQDFQTGRCKLYILTPEEVQQYEDYLSGE